MNYSRARNAYSQTAVQAEIHPVKLVHMVYERILLCVEEAVRGIDENNPRLRGESIGKAIALITELRAAVKADDHSESASFLRGLYDSILMELPKASLNNDVGILRQTHSYIKKLKEIWEDTAMRENGLECRPGKDTAHVPQSEDRYGSRRSGQEPHQGGLSVSI